MSKPNALDVVKRCSMVAAVVELGRPTVCVASDPLSHLQIASVLKIGGDSGRPEAVAGESASKVCVPDSALNHLVGVRAVDRLVRELPGSPDGASEEQTVRLTFYSSRFDVGVEVLLKCVVARNLPLLPSFLIEPDHRSSPDGHDVSHSKRDDGLDAGEGERHDSDDCSVSKANN